MTNGADANPPHAAAPSEGDILIDLMTSHWKSQGKLYTSHLMPVLPVHSKEENS